MGQGTERTGNATRQTCDGKLHKGIVTRETTPVVSLGKNPVNFCFYGKLLSSRTRRGYARNVNGLNSSGNYGRFPTQLTGKLQFIAKGNGCPLSAKKDNLLKSKVTYFMYRSTNKKPEKPIGWSCARNFSYVWYVKLVLRNFIVIFAPDKQHKTNISISF